MLESPAPHLEEDPTYLPPPLDVELSVEGAESPRQQEHIDDDEARKADIIMPAAPEGEQSAGDVPLKEESEGMEKKDEEKPITDAGDAKPRSTESSARSRQDKRSPRVSD